MSNEQLKSELGQMISRVEEVQEQRGLSDGLLLKNYPDLGSTKTWTDRLRPRRFDQLKVSRWHALLSRVCQVIDGGLPDEVYSTQAPFHVEMLARLEKLERQSTDRRILCCLAANGTGKTSFSRWAVSQSPVSRRVVRIRPTWRNKPLHIYTGMARALGKELHTTNVAQAEEEVIAMLTKTDVTEQKAHAKTLFIDQAHEGGVALMHILRALVDETKSRFVYCAYQTAYRQVINGSSDALIEAQAFLGRCLKPVFDLYANGTRYDDVVHYLVAVADLRAGAAKSLAAEITVALNQTTNLRLLDDAIAQAIIEDGDDPSAETIKAKVFSLSGLDASKVGKLKV